MTSSLTNLQRHLEYQEVEYLINKTHYRSI
jgi:hypothetical protein